MSTIIWIVILIVALAAGIGAGYFIGYNNRKKTAEAQIGSAEAEATRLVNEAIKTAEQKRKEAVLEAKDEAFKLKAEVDAQKAEADKEIKQRRAEISRQENRIDQKETALDRKTEALEKKEEELKKRAAEAEERLAEIDALRAKEMERLETLAGLSQEDAREVLLHKVDEELTHEKAVRVAAYETDLKENCDNIARNLIGQAVSRCAADHCSETTVSVVPLPSDEMKGRIIGREGRNIRALETATGVDLIIDDTPEAITLSSFDQTRREVARMTLERLIGDGRIHPARIEETVEKCRHELELQMKREGERAVMELGIHGLHPDLIKLIGRLKYRTSFGQNALTHSMEVAWVAGLLAGEMGVNVTMARRRGAQDPAGLHHSGCRCHQRCTPGCPPRERGKLRQASGKSGGDLFQLRGCGAGLCRAGRPRSAHHGQARCHQRRSGDPAGTLHCQEDRGHAGLPRPDQGQCDPREPRCGVRKIKFCPKSCRADAQQLFSACNPAAKKVSWRKTDRKGRTTI